MILPCSNSPAGAPLNVSQVRKARGGPMAGIPTHRLDFIVFLFEFSYSHSFNVGMFQE